MVIITSSLSTNDKKVTQALSDIKAYESGEIVFNDRKYLKAVDILTLSDIDSVWFKIRPRFTKRIKEALFLSRKFLNVHAGYKKSREITGALLKLNRKLSHYAQGESWEEYMHIAAMFYYCRPYVFFTPNYVRANLSQKLFDDEVMGYISEFVFQAPDPSVLVFEANGLVGEWKSKVISFLEKMTAVNTPVKLIYLAIEIEATRSLLKNLNKHREKAWLDSNLSIEDQLWYYGKIVDFLSISLSNEKLNPNIFIMLDQLRGFLRQIYAKVERKDRTTNELVPVQGG